MTRDIVLFIIAALVVGFAFGRMARGYSFVSRRILGLIGLVVAYYLSLLLGAIASALGI